MCRLLTKSHVLLVLLGLGAGLLFCELALRLMGAAPAVSFIEKGRFRLSSNPKLAYELVPNLDYKGQNLAFWDYRERSNSLGFRDVEHSLEKSPETFRILVLGDSIVAGHHVARRSEIFPARIEELLNGRGVRTEVISFGVPGYNTGQELELFKERGLAFKPDLVILSYCLNDREGIFHGVTGALLDLEKRNVNLNLARLSPVLAKSALYRLFRYRILADLLGDGRAYPEFQKYDSSDSVDRSVRELSSLARQRGFGIFVAVFPFFDDLEQYSRLSEHQYIQRVCQDAGIECVDLLSDLRNCQREAREKMGADLTHPNSLGHACAAMRLADFIQAHFDLSRYSIAGPREAS